MGRRADKQAAALNLPRGMLAADIRAELTKDRGEVEFHYDGTGLFAILVGGRNLLMGYYIIGTQTGGDDENNVISVGSDGHTMKGNATYPGSPFSISAHRVDARSLRVDLSVGPLTRDHKSLSIPMDMVKGLFQTFAFAGTGYVVGCGNSWSARSGAGGRFDAIPQPCFIPGHGAVGIARANRAAGWVEIVAPTIATIRRTVVGGAIVDVGCVRHPYTENAEYAWVHDPALGPLLRAGTTLRLSEIITVTPWGAGPVPEPGPTPTGSPAFTMGPRPFGMNPDSGGIEWQTDVSSTGDVHVYLESAPGVLLQTVHDPVFQRDHQRTMLGLLPGTRYLATVTVRDGAGRTATASTPFQTKPGESPPPPPPPSPPPPQEAAMRVTIPAQTFEVPAAGGTVQVALTVMPVGGPVEPPPPPPPPPPPVGTHPTLRAAPFIGYGVVNRWPWIDPERLAKALYEAGLTFTAIEWIPWWKSMTDGVNASSTTGGFVTTTYPTEARAFIETMTRYSITTFVIMRNWNSEAEQRMSDDDFRRDLQALQNIAAPADMLPTGRPVVCVEGVSEPSGSGKHMAWNRMVSDEWYRKGGKTLANRSGEQAGPFTWGDYHWCQDFTEANAKAALNNTDCGPVINPGPARSAKMTRAAINRDVGFLVYDFHKGPPELPEGIDFATIAAMGVEIQKGGKGTYVWNPGAPTTPDTPPTGDADAIDVQQLEWIRPWESDASDFVKTVRLTGVTADAGRIGFNTNGGLVGWPNGTVDAAPANFLSFVLIDGKWCGGTWEWMGANTGERRMSRNLSWHIAGGDGPGNPLEQKVRNHPVKSGDMVAVMVASCCRKPGDRPLQPGQRSNIVLVRMA